MQPDRTNYEIWLIDYLDGTLDKAGADQLSLFLDANPDIKEEVADILTYKITSTPGSFQNKNSLKKKASDLSEKQFDLLCVSSAENDLSEQQAAELEMILQENPDRRKTLELFHRIKLVAPAIKFRNKAGLRKLTFPQKIIRLSVLGLSAAAGIALMISLFNSPVSYNNTGVSLSSLNTGKDSIKITPATNTIAANTAPYEKKPAPDKGRILALSTLQKTISEEMKNFPGKTISGDTGSFKPESASINISKIDFKQEISLGEKEFTSTLVAINTEEIIPIEVQEKPGFNDFIAKTFRQRILKTKTPETGSLKAYEIADAGINGLNKMLGWQMSLQKTRDDKGDLKSLYFSSKILKFNAPVKKVQLAP